jgi:hypothetical protein
MNDFVIHACEQVLRFTTVKDWNDLSEERKVQLSFNMGVFALGLDLTKEEGYDSIAGTAMGDITVQELHEHLRSLVVSHGIEIKEENVARLF